MHSCENFMQPIKNFSFWTWCKNFHVFWTCMHGCNDLSTRKMVHAIGNKGCQLPVYFDLNFISSMQGCSKDFSGGKARWWACENRLVIYCLQNQTRKLEVSKMDMPQQLVSGQWILGQNIPFSLTFCILVGPNILWAWLLMHAVW